MGFGAWCRWNLGRGGSQEKRLQVVLAACWGLITTEEVDVDQQWCVLCTTLVM